MVQGDMKQMDSDYVKGVIMHNYGPTIFNGIGIPIPILNKDIAARTAISDEDIMCKIYDYGVSRRSKPILSETSFLYKYTSKFNSFLTLFVKLKSLKILVVIFII